MDVYANEIRKLACLAGITGDGLEHIVRLIFVNGFPDYIRMELKQVENIKTMSVSDILSMTRALTAHKTSQVAAVAVNQASKQQSGTGKEVSRESETRTFKEQCFQ